MKDFRGLTKDGKMVYGYLFKSWETTYILWGTTNGIPTMTEVIPATVAQQVGRKDKSGKDVYTGDSLRTPGGQILKVEIPDLINGDGKFRSIVIEECELEEKSK